MKLTLKTPAKINLFLHVVGKRDDGYHLLESIFAPISVFDEITVNDCDHVVVNSDIPNNICLKAAQLLKGKYNISKGCEVTILKKIPIAAGLGGGSSNAAATLKLLNQLWDLKLSNQILFQLASELGADVPYFIDHKCAFVSGIGEVINPIKLNRAFPILLINPNVVVSTKEVYQRGFPEFTKSISDPQEYILKGHNDLQNNSIALCPQIMECLDFLNAQDGIEIARMSGSGATCFGIFNSFESLLKAFEKVPSVWWKHHQLLEL